MSKFKEGDIVKVTRMPTDEEYRQFNLDSWTSGMTDDVGTTQTVYMQMHEQSRYRQDGFEWYDLRPSCYNFPDCVLELVREA